MTPMKNLEVQKEVAVKKVVVQLGKKELILDINDAKELQKVLNELFGQVIVEKKVVEEHHHYDHKPFYWNYPYISYGSTTSGQFKYDNNVVYCANSSSTFPAKFEAKFGDKKKEGK
jgi:hypothetical protein